ncbi:MAG: hypothetical protein JW822_03300 [Spirochaetales bacterium]|nr:hypothetical protein [Spirochaetales bacterium]
MKKIFLIFPALFFLSFCVHNPLKHSAKEYTDIGMDSFQGPKAYPLIMDESLKEKFTGFPSEHSLIWHLGGGDRSIQIYDTETGIKRYLIYNDPNSKLNSAFVIDNQKKIMVLDYVFPGGSIFRIYDFLNDKIIDKIPYHGFIHYFGQNKILYCSLQDMPEQKYEWFIINPLTKEKWKNELTKVLTKKQIFFYPHSTIGIYHARTVNMNLKKRIIIGEIENNEKEQPEFVIVSWEGDGEKVRVMPFKEQVAGKRQYIDEIELAPNGNWMKWQEHIGDYESDKIAIYLHHVSADYPESISEPIFCGVFSEDSDATFLIHPELGPCYCIYDYPIKEKIFIYPLKELEQKIAAGTMFVPKGIDVTQLMRLSDNNSLSLARYSNRLCFISEGKRKLNIFEVTDYAKIQASGYSYNFYKPITAFCLAPNGEYLAVAFEDNEFSLYQIKDNGLEKYIQLNGSVNLIEISDNSEFIYTVKTNIIQQWDCHGNFIREFKEHNSQLSDICASRDMAFIAAADTHKNLIIWNQKGEKLGSLRLSHVSLNLKFSDDAERLICNTGASDPEYIDLGNKKILLVGSSEENNWFFPLSSPDKDKFVSYNKADNNYYIKDLDGEITAYLLFYPCIVTEDNWNKTIDSWLKAERLSTVINTVNAAEIAGIIITNDNRIITGHKDGTIIFRNNKGITDKIVKAHNAAVSILALSHQGDYLASSGCYDKKVVIWKSNGEYVNSLVGFSGDILRLSFNKKDEIIIQSSHKIEKRQISGQITFSYDTDGMIKAVNPEGTHALVAEDEQAYLIDILSLKKTNLVGIEKEQKTHYDAVIDTSIMGGGISAHNDMFLIKDNAKIELFNPDGIKINETKTNINVDVILGYVRSAIYSPTGNMLAALFYDTRQVGNLYAHYFSVKIKSADGRDMFACCHYDLEQSPDLLYLPMCFSYAADRLITAHGTEIFIWDLTGTLITSINTIVDDASLQVKIPIHSAEPTPIHEYKPKENFTSVNFSSRHIVTGGSSKSNPVRVLDLFTFNEVLKLETAGLQVALTKDSRYLFCGDDEGFLRKYDIGTGKQIWETRIFTKKIQLLALSDNNRHAAVCRGFKINELEIVIVDCSTGKILSRITDFDITQDDVDPYSLKFSKNSKYLAFAGIEDGEKLCVWDLDGQKVYEFKHKGDIHDFEFTSDNRYLITAHRQGSKFLSTVTVWDLAAKEEIWSYRNIDGIIQCITVTADNRYIFTGDSEDTIHQFSFKSGRLLNSVQYHTHGILDIFITDYDKHLVSYDKYNNIYIWNLADFNSENEK